MWFMVIGCLLSAAKLFDLGPVAHWSWWWVLSPFAAAAAWWLFADAIGLTQQRAMDRERKRVTDRRERHLKNMGLDIFSRKPGRRPPPE